MTQQSTNDQRRPFLAAPSPKRYFPAAAIEEARQRIVRAIARNEGPAMLVGGAGTGKSLLLAVLAEQFASRVAVVTLVGAQLCTRRALLQMILCELGLPYRGMDEGELRLSILEHLRGKNGASQRMLLLIDEADALPTRLLHELRVLTNVAAEGLPLVSLVLAGGPILEERFADPQLDMFAQRIAARCYLAPLGRDETLQYVRSQVAAAGMKPERLFTADALDAIHSATGGVPRVINQLGDQLVWMAEETGCAPLDGGLVQQAWSELQQLPAPWNSEGHASAASAGEGNVIEFGELDAIGSVITAPDHPAPSTSPGFETDDSDEEMPASIPIAAGRTNRASLEIDQFHAAIDATEQLLESFDQFEGLEIRPADPEPVIEHEGSTAANPFAEPFDEEEIVLDPYAAFEAELLRTAPQVINRMDRAFAGELHRCVQRAAGTKPAANLVDDLDFEPIAAAKVSKSTARLADSQALPAGAYVRLHELTGRLPRAAASSREVLVIEDDDCTVAAIIPGKQFRRLFSCLESTASRTLHG